MKAMKKLTALILAVCMLVGMPLSIDVSAVGTADATEFKAYGIYQTTETMLARLNNGSNGVTRENSMWASWSMNPSNDGCSYAVVAVDAAGNILNTNVLEWEVGAGVNGQFFWTFKNNVTWSTVKAAVAEGGAYAGATLKFAFIEDTKYAEKLTGSAQGDGVVDDWFSAAKVTATTSDKTWFMKATTVVTVDNVKRDAAIVPMYTDGEFFDVVEACIVDDIYMHVRYNAPVQNKGAGSYDYSLRIVDADNNHVYKAADGTFNTAGNGTEFAFATIGSFDQSGEYFSGTIKDGQPTYSQMLAKLDEANNASDSDERYYLRLLIHELNVNWATQGSVTRNGFVDHFWDKNALKPLIANSNSSGGDGRYVDLALPEEGVFYMTDAQLVRDGKGTTDKVVVTFSEPLHEKALNIQYGAIRLYDKKGQLMKLVAATKKVDPSTGTNAQWAVEEKWFNDDHTQIVFNLTTRAGINDTKATYDSIVDAFIGVTDSEGNAVVDATTRQFINGYHLAYSLHSNANGTFGQNEVAKNGRVDTIPSADGDLLWANNRQSEERATCPIEEFKITDVSVYADKFVILTFSEDINMDADALKAINTNSIWLGAHKVSDIAGSPANDGTNIHYQMTNARQYGNSGNKIVMDLANRYSTLVERVENYKTREDAVPVELYVRIEGGGTSAATVVPGFVSADGAHVLYRSHPETTWSGRHMIKFNSTVETASAGVTVKKVTGDPENNALIVQFSEPVKYSGAKVVFNKKNSDGSMGETTKLRTQVSLQRFYHSDTDPLQLDQRESNKYLYQSDATGYKPVNANGVEVENEYSEYWAFIFPEGDVEAAMGYYANNNIERTAQVDYGFGVYESGYGTNDNQIKNQADGLPDAMYLEDFATEDGQYLLVNSAFSGNRHFTKLSIEEDDMVTVSNAYLVSDKTIEVEFSEPVTIAQGANNVYGYSSIRVIKDNYVVNANGTNLQLALTPAAVEPNEDGYTAVWRFTATQSISEWTNKNYFNNATYVDPNSGITLCLSLQDNAGHSYDGAVPYVQNADGMPLQAAKTYGKNSCSNTDIASACKAVAVVDGTSYDDFAAAVEAANANGGTLKMVQNVTFTGDVLNIENGATLDINGKTLAINADGLVAMDGKVIDSADGVGMIKVAGSSEQAVVFATANPQMPLYDKDNGGYKLFNVTMKNLGVVPKSDDSAIYGFRFEMKTAAYDLLADAENCGMKVYFDMYSPEFDAENNTVPGEFESELLTKYANGIKSEGEGVTTAYILEITGLDELKAPGDFKVIARIASASGVVMREDIKA